MESTCWIPILALTILIHALWTIFLYISGLHLFFFFFLSKWIPYMGRFILRIMQRKVGTTEHMFSIHVCVCAYSVISDALHIHGLGVAKSLQSCPTLCDPIDGSPPGSPFPGILQARTLEWVAIAFSNAWKWKVKVKSLSRVRLLETPWTAAHQAPPSMGFSRREYWSGVPLPSPMDWVVINKW